jgi:hypothetical protein
MTGRNVKVRLDLFSDEISIDLALNEDKYAHQIQSKLKQAFNLVTKSREYAINKAKTRHDRNSSAGDDMWVTVK